MSSFSAENAVVEVLVEIVVVLAVVALTRLGLYVLVLSPLTL